MEGTSRGVNLNFENADTSSFIPSGEDGPLVVANGQVLGAEAAGWAHTLMYGIQAETQRMQEWVYRGKITNAMRGDATLAAVHAITRAAPRHNARIFPDADSGANATYALNCILVCV